MSYEHNGKESIKALPIITHYEVFLSRLNITLARYPSSQKFVFRQITQNKAMDVWNSLLDAEFYYNEQYKKKALLNASKELRKLQSLLRIGKESGFMGYVSADDMRYIKQSKDKTMWQRELSDVEKMRKDEIWMKNASVEYFKLSKMLGEIKEELGKWCNSI